MADPARGHLKITTGSTVIDVMLDSKDAFQRGPGTPRSAFGKLQLKDFSRGLGGVSLDAEPGSYLIGTNVDCRWAGVVMPGPREEADMTGIASGYRVLQSIVHGGVRWVLTSNNTNTKVYRVETGAWAEKLNVNSVVGTCLVSYKDVVAVGLGASTAFKYSSNNGSSWTDSTKTGNGKYMNFATVVQPARSALRVAYVRNPNELYFTEDLTNSGASSTSSTVGDANNDEFTSIIADDNGILLMGKRQYLYTIDSDGNVWAVDGPRRYYATSEAAGGAGMANYENPVKIEGRIYYPYEDRFLLEIAPGLGEKREHMEPAWWGQQVPRLHLPLNAMTNVAGWLCVAIGSANASTIRSAAQAQGGTALLANTFVSTSELYFGKYMDTGDGQGERWVWHGSLLTCTDLLRYAWYSDDDNYLYLASAGSESADEQQKRAFVPPDNPLFVQSSSTVKLNTGTWTLETGRYTAGEPHWTKTWRIGRFTSRGLASTTPSLAVKYRVADDDVSTVYSTLATYTSSTTARTGTSFSSGTSGKGVRFQFVGVGDSGNTYALLYDAELEFILYQPQRDAITTTFKAVNGKVVRSGARATTSMKELRAALDAWKDATDPATVVDTETGDSWAMDLRDWQEVGIGRARRITLMAVEAP